MSKDNKIIDMSNYIDPENELSSEMIQAYLDAADMETPDLWNKIETGFEQEIEAVKNEELERELKLKKARKKKWIGILAAAFLLVLIAVPVIMSGLGKRDKGETSVADNSMNDSYEMEDAEEAGEEYAEEMVAESAVAEDSSGVQSAVGMQNGESATEAAPFQTEGETEGDTVQAPNNENMLDSDELQIDERRLEVQGTISIAEDGSYVFTVEKVVTSEYEELTIEKGDVIALKVDEITVQIMDDSADISVLLDSVSGIKSELETEGNKLSPNYVARLIDLL